MRLVAISDFYFGTGNAAEVLQAGDEFTPPGTGVMNALEHARSMIRRGCCLPADDPKAAAAVARWNAHRAWAEGFFCNGGRA